MFFAQIRVRTCITKASTPRHCKTNVGWSPRSCTGATWRYKVSSSNFGTGLTQFDQAADEPRMSDQVSAPSAPPLPPPSPGSVRNPVAVHFLKCWNCQQVSWGIIVWSLLSWPMSGLSTHPTLLVCQFASWNQPPSLQSLMEHTLAQPLLLLDCCTTGTIHLTFQITQLSLVAWKFDSQVGEPFAGGLHLSILFPSLLCFGIAWHSFAPSCSSCSWVSFLMSFKNQYSTI